MMRRILAVALAVVVLAVPQATHTQATDDVAAQNAKKARATLDAMVQALGGEAWLNMQNQMRQGHIAAFFHGQPDMGTTDFWEFHSWPDHDRVEFTKHRDVLQFYLGREGWEVTYRGKKALPKDIVDDFLRRRDHSIETAVKVWLKDPKTILIYEGQHVVERHLAERGLTAQVVRLDGAVENAVRLGVADVIADVVSTGTTLRQAGLEPVGEPILRSVAVLIRRTGQPGNGPVTQLLRRLQGVLVARSYVMVAYDVPAARMTAACALTPGIESPTVSPLAREGWVAVQAMVPRADVHKIMDDLYDLGARAILVTDIHACRL